ncbi:MAG: alpha/beta hydrolase [Thermoplasmata archaeon]|nr:MAG: alpha/beta hydrolase [Thermoplasmata archaeon]
MGSGFVEVDDVTIPYWIEGNGIPCIVTCDPSYQRKVLSQQLRQHFKFIFMEQRVLHVHEKPISYENVTMDTLVEDIETIRNHLVIDKIAVLGHSMCGLLALEYAKKYTEHVTHIIMLNTPPHLEYWASIKDYWNANVSEERMKLYKERQENLEKIRGLSHDEIAVMRLVVQDPLRWYDLSFDSSDLWAGYRENSEGQAHIMKHLATSYDIRENAPVRIPVFMSQSIHDYIVPYTLWDDYTDVFTDLTLHLFKRSGHTPQLEEQELFDKLLIDWLKTH